VAGLATVLGSGAMTNSIDDAVTADAFLIAGSNTTEAHPVIGAKIKRALGRGAKMVVIDPRRTELARMADVHLQIKPGSDVAVLNCLLHVIIDQGLLDTDYIRQHTENFAATKAMVAEYTPDYVANLAGVEKKDLVEAARIYGCANSAAVFYTMGITQHRNGTDNVRCIANLALATGNLGRPGTGINPLRGQNNVQGACDMGALPDVYPGYQPVGTAAAKFAQLWGTELPDNRGLTVGEMLAGSLKAMYIIGENPVLSDPDSNHVVEALKKLDFLVVQDLFLTETAQLADIVLPAVSFAEKEGTFVNTERRVQKVNKAIQAVGQSRADWRVLTQLANLMGHKWDYSCPQDVFAEITQVAPAFAGLSYARVEQEGIPWPCPKPDHPGTPILHQNGPARGKGIFSAIAHKGAQETPDSEYPLLLTTGRNLFHYHTGTMSRNASGLAAQRDTELMEISFADAQALDLVSGSKVKVISRRGEITVPVEVTPRVPQGVVFMTFHFRESAANILTNPVLDPESLTPELKVAAVRIEKL